MSDYNFLARFWIQAWALRSAGPRRSGSLHHRKYSLKRAEWAANVSAVLDMVFFSFSAQIAATTWQRGDVPLFFIIWLINETTSIF